MRIGVVHGPNLNLLGTRESDLYGTATLADIDAALAERAAALGTGLVTFQSNVEGELIDWVQTHASAVDGWLVNAGGYSHTSVALRDALAASEHPFVEVHLTNIHSREPFRRRSVLADLAVGVISGFREGSYLLGLEGLVEHIRRRQ